MRGVVRTAATLEVAADILEDCWDVRTRLEVPLGPLLDGERGLYRPIQANYLLAAPTPTVAAILRDAGDPRFAHVGATRLSFRLPKERKEAEDAE